MHNIPYHFDTPVPSHFRKIGWMDNPKTAVFLSWIFSICSPSHTKSYVGFREVELNPFEFIFTRSYAVDKCGLTDNEVRTQIARLEDQEYIHKTSKTIPNQFTVYKWSERLFDKRDNQTKTKETTNEEPDEELPVTDEFLQRKKHQYCDEDVEMACEYYTERFIDGPYPKPLNPSSWFNDCLRRRYWEGKE